MIFSEDQLLFEEIQNDALEIHNETESIDNHNLKEDAEGDDQKNYSES